MANEVRFGQTQVNDVHISTQGGKKAGRVMDNIFSKPTDNGIHAAVVEAGNLARSLKVADDNKEANEAKNHWRQFYTSEGYIQASDTNKAEMVEEFYGATIDRSESYQNSLKGYSQGEYYRASTGRHKDLITSGVNNAPASIEAFMEEDVDTNTGISNRRTLGLTKADGIADYIEKFPYMKGSEVEIAQSLLTTDYQRMYDEVSSATNMEGLSNAIANTEDIKKDLQSPFLLNSKQKEAMQANKTRESVLQNLIKAKKEQFKNEAYSRIAVAVEGKYRMLPTAVSADIDMTADNPLSAAKQKIQYMEKHVEITEADSYNASYSAGNRPAVLPDNPLLKEERQKMVTSTLFNHFSSNNMSEFVRVADNENDMTSDLGTSILTQFNKIESTDDLNGIMNKLNLINAQPKGATVLRQMFTDDDYIRMMSIKFMSQARPTESIDTIRNYIDQQAQAVSTVKLDPNKTASMYKKAVKLGTQADAYINVMQGLLKINPQLAQAEMNNIYSTFEKQVGKKNGLKYDTSMASNPADGRGIIDPEAVDLAIDGILPEGTTSKTFLPGNNIIAKDAFSGIITVRNVGDVVQESETNTTNRLLKEHEELIEEVKTDPVVGAKVALKSFTRTVVDNIGDFIQATPNVLGDLVGNMTSRLSQHMWDSMSPGEQKFFEDSGLDWTKETKIAIADSIDMAIKERPTKMPGVSNVTYGEDDKLRLVTAIEKNKWEVQRLERVKREMMVDDILVEFEDSEGFGDKLTSIITGGYGMTKNKREEIEAKTGKSMSDKEAASYFLNDIATTISNKNPNITGPQVKALTSSVYNMGANSLNWSSIDYFIKYPTEENLQKALLTKIYSEGKSVKGIGKRRAEDYNKANPSKEIHSVEQHANGDMIYYSEDNKVIFKAKSNKPKHGKSRAGIIKIK